MDLLPVDDLLVTASRYTRASRIPVRHSLAAGSCANKKHAPCVAVVATVASPWLNRPCPQTSCEIPGGGLSIGLMNDGGTLATRILVALGLPKSAAFWLSFVMLGGRVMLTSVSECD